MDCPNISIINLENRFWYGHRGFKLFIKNLHKYYACTVHEYSKVGVRIIKFTSNQSQASEITHGEILDFA